MNAVNPYKPVYPVGDSPSFIGRADLLRDVVRVLRRSHDPGLILYGQRRIGKTSILRELLARLPKIAVLHPVYFDLLDKTSWSLGEIVTNLASEIARQTGQPNPNLGDSPAFNFAETWLSEFLQSLPSEHTLVLLLDEFGVLVDPRSTQSSGKFFPFLRNLLNRYSPRLKFVAVLSRSLNELSSVALQLFRGLVTLRVSLLSKSETIELVRTSQVEGTLNWSEAALEKIWELTNGHPLLTQQLCAEVWRRSHLVITDEVALATAQDVEQCVDSALEAGRNSLEWLWNGLPSAGRIVVSALAGSGINPITADELIRILSESGVRVVIRELQEAPRLLQEWDLIEPGPEPYRFRVELLRRWIVQNKPLERVEDEMDYIEPLAENLYQAAARMYQHQLKEQAVQLLRQAVEANPNHERASMLLADVLTSLGRTIEALNILDPLYVIRPFAIWPRLVRVLLAKAREETNDDMRLETYQRILDVDPTHTEARQASSAIWRERAEKFLESNEIEQAYTAFLKAGLADKANELEDQIYKARLDRGFAELKQLEAARHYSEGLERAEQLSAEFPDYPSWPKIINQFRARVDLMSPYERGLAALELGDRTTAANLLGQVAARNPFFEEVTRFLHKSVTGVDVAVIQHELGESQRILIDLRKRLAGAQKGEALPTPTGPLSSLQTDLPSEFPVELKPLFPVEPPVPTRVRMAGTTPAKKTTAPLSANDPASKLRAIFKQIRSGSGSLIGLPSIYTLDLTSLAAVIAAEEGLASFRGRTHSASSNPNYAIWRGIMQGVYGIDLSLTVEMQARQLRERLHDLDPAYITFLSKVSLVTLEVPVMGQTVIKLMTPQEIQAKILEIITHSLMKFSSGTPLLLVMPGADQMDSMSLHLLKGVANTVSSIPLGFLLSYPPGALDPELRSHISFVEIA